MQIVLQKLFKFAQLIPRPYWIFVAGIVLITSLVVMTMLGSMSFVLLAILIFFPPWLTTGYYILSKKLSAPLWVDTWHWISSPIALLLVLMAFSSFSVRVAGIIVLTLLTVWLVVKQGFVFKIKKNLA